MKNQLFTQKSFIGMIMVLVLALSVQGNLADALTFGATGTNDLETIVRGANFSVTFAVTAVSEERKSAYTDYIVDPDDPTRYFLDSTSGDNDNDTYDSGERTVSTANAFYYNNETVRISVSGAGARITSIGTNLVTPTGSITLKEGGSGAEELVASVVVNGSTTSYGEITITASDATPSEDYPSGVSRAPNFVLTNYAVRYNSEVGATRTINLVGVTNGVAIGYDDQRDQPIYNGDSSHYPVTYTIPSGSGDGMLYIREGNRSGSPATSLTTSTAAKVLLDMGGSTNTITATLRGSFEESKGIYIFGNPQLDITGGDGEEGGANSTLGDALQVTLRDSASTPAGVVGVPIKFDVTDKSPSGGILSQADESTGVTIVDASNEEIDSPIPGSTLYVRTGADGVANIDFQLGTIPGEQTVTAGALGIARLTETFTLTATPTDATRQLFAEDIDRHGTTNIYTLVARVENGGQPAVGETVTFTTTKGLLTSGTSTAKTVTATTNAAGKARVTYNIGDTSGTAEVVASISVVAGTLVTQLQEVIFNVRGGSSGQQQQQQQQQPTNTITIAPSTITGEPGDEVTLTITSDPSVRFVTLSSPDFANTLFSPQSDQTPFQSTLTLPDEDGEYDISATSAGLIEGSATVTVETGILGEISITQIGTPSDGAQSFSITVVDTDGDRISGALTVRVSGAGFTTRNVETLNGIGNARLTLPTTAGLYTLTASATDYTSGTTQVRIAGTTTTETTTETTTTETTTTVSVPDSVSIVGPSQRDGTANTALDASLIVQVVDEDGDAVEDARVIFRVRQGQGRLSDRGNGRAIAVQTDSQGYGRATYTPISASSTVEAEARGVTRTVTFTITASGGTTTPTPRDTDTPTTPGAISPVVHVGAAQRPGMLWVDGGNIYALVQADVQEFASGVENATHLAIGGGKVYWTAENDDSGGTINSANLNGTGVTELASIFAVPMGIAVDVPNSKLYWTNDRGRIQSSNLDGSRIQNVIPGGLEGAKDIALAGGNAYWTQGGNVRFVNLRGQKQIRNVSTGTDTAGSLAIGGGKVYWTEMTGESGGTINSANLNGTGVTELASILATPSGIAVDRARDKLLWTNSRGRMQRANLDGSKIENVVSGLGSPGDMVLSNSLSIATTATTPTATRTTTTASKYDVNSDGTVDNTDAGLVADALGTSNTKYDVNGDGTVNFLDLLLVFDNRDSGTAGAPTIVGMQMTAAQVDVLQEQIDLLIATGDRSPAAMRTLIYLQQLIATARPEKTQLLANFPNPFNPETWMPYELATDTTVKITIYNTQGVVIRTLVLGHQAAGYYTGRDRAAYWDGRNALGERVASGIYFYQFETDSMSAMRKMVILK